MLNTRQLMEIKRQYKLTDREIQTVKLISKGVESNDQITKEMGVEVGTSKIHLVNIYRKVERTSKLGLILRLWQRVGTASTGR
ncbi:MAG TPA: LuxR C-terminal-related transcriptional regulator [Sedimentisphaerales bacterium]|nr:LuxR C-terminal-related transcriptional regulator [Sedimentisphaerales bacterium]